MPKTVEKLYTSGLFLAKGIADTHEWLAICQSIATNGVGSQYHQLVIDYSRHFLAQIAESSDRSQKHPSARSVLTFLVYGGKGKDKFALGRFFEAYEYALDRQAQQNANNRLRARD